MQIANKKGPRAYKTRGLFYLQLLYITASLQNRVSAPACHPNRSPLSPPRAARSPFQQILECSFVVKAFQHRCLVALYCRDYCWYTTSPPLPPVSGVAGSSRSDKI